MRFAQQPSQRRRLMMRLSTLRAHLRAMLHHLFVAHAAVLRRIVLSRTVTTLGLMLLHHLAVLHHLFIV